MVRSKLPTRKPRRQRAYQSGFPNVAGKVKLGRPKGSGAARAARLAEKQVGTALATVEKRVPSRAYRYPDELKQLGVACFIATGGSGRAVNLMAELCPGQVPHRETIIEWLAAGIRPTEEHQALANSLKEAQTNARLDDALEIGLAAAQKRVESGDENLWNLNGYIKIVNDARVGRDKPRTTATITIGSVSFGVSDGRKDTWDVEGELVGSGSG